MTGAPFTRFVRLTSLNKLINARRNLNYGKAIYADKEPYCKTQNFAGSSIILDESGNRAVCGFFG